MPYNELTKKHLESLKLKIQEVMSSKGLDSSGQTSASLEVNQTQLLADRNIYFLDQGRSPGTFPPVDKIKEWMVNKLGLDAFGTDKGIAFLIGRKIKRDGTEIFRDKSKGIELDLLAENMLDELIKELPEQAAAEALTWL